MKDLKKEYEELILPEIPDLWDRIEAALPVEEEATAPVKTNTKSNVKPFNKAKIYRWSTVAAACLCAFIVIPVALKDVEGCGSSAEPAAYDSANAPAAMEAAPMEEYEMAAPEAAVESADSGYSYNDVMEEAAEEEVLSATGTASNSTDDWGDDTLNIWDAESVGDTVSSENTTGSPESATVFEVTAQIESEVISDGTVTGYSLLITEDPSDMLGTDHIIGYFSEEYQEILTDKDVVIGQSYTIQIRLNYEKQHFEILDLQ